MSWCICEMPSVLLFWSEKHILSLFLTFLFLITQVATNNQNCNQNMCTFYTYVCDASAFIQREERNITEAEGTGAPTSGT